MNVVRNSILDDMQLKALGYNNCQAWQHLTGLWARIEGQMGCGALQLYVCVCVCVCVCVIFHLHTDKIPLVSLCTLSESQSSYLSPSAVL